MTAFESKFGKKSDPDSNGISKAISDMKDLNSKVVYGILCHIKDIHHYEFDGTKEWVNEVFMPLYAEEYMSFWKQFETDLEEKIGNSTATTNDLLPCWEGLKSRIFISHPLILHMLITSTGYIPMDIDFRIQFANNCQQVIQLYNTVSPNDPINAKFVKKNTKMMLLVILSLIFLHHNSVSDEDADDTMNDTNNDTIQFCSAIESLSNIFSLNGPIFLGLAGLNSPNSNNFALQAFSNNALLILSKLSNSNFPDIDDFQSLAASATYSIINNFSNQYHLQLLPNHLFHSLITTCISALSILNKCDMILTTPDDPSPLKFNILQSHLFNHLLDNLPSHLPHIIPFLPFIYSVISFDPVIPLPAQYSILSYNNNSPSTIQTAVNDNNIIYFDPSNSSYGVRKSSQSISILLIANISGTILNNQVQWHSASNLLLFLFPLLIHNKDSLVLSNIILYLGNLLAVSPNKATLVSQFNNHLDHLISNPNLIQLLLDYAISNATLHHCVSSLIIHICPLDPNLSNLFYFTHKSLFCHFIIKFSLYSNYNNPSLFSKALYTVSTMQMDNKYYIPIYYYLGCLIKNKAHRTLISNILVLPSIDTIPTHHEDPVIDQICHLLHNAKYSDSAYLDEPQLLVGLINAPILSIATTRTLISKYNTLVAQLDELLSLNALQYYTALVQIVVTIQCAIHHKLDIDYDVVHHHILHLPFVVSAVRDLIKLKLDYSQVQAPMMDIVDLISPYTTLIPNKIGLLLELSQLQRREVDNSYVLQVIQNVNKMELDKDTCTALTSRIVPGILDYSLYILELSTRQLMPLETESTLVQSTAIMLIQYYTQYNGEMMHIEHILGIDMLSQLFLIVVDVKDGLNELLELVDMAYNEMGMVGILNRMCMGAVGQRELIRIRMLVQKYNDVDSETLTRIKWVLWTLNDNKWDAAVPSGAYGVIVRRLGEMRGKESAGTLERITEILDTPDTQDTWLIGMEMKILMQMVDLSKLGINRIVEVVGRFEEIKEIVEDRVVDMDEGMVSKYREMVEGIGGQEERPRSPEMGKRMKIENRKNRQQKITWTIDCLFD